MRRQGGCRQAFITFRAKARAKRKEQCAAWNADVATQHAKERFLGIFDVKCSFPLDTVYGKQATLPGGQRGHLQAGAGAPVNPTEWVKRLCQRSNAQTL
jgi:hypothetical protein